MQSASQPSSRIQKIGKRLMRSLKRIDYRNVALVSGYAETEAEYKSFKRSSSQLSGLIESIRSYEHGNTIYKSFKKGVQYLNDKASLKLYKNTDLYEKLASIGTSLKTSSDSKASSLGSKMETSYTSISKSKRVLNSRLSMLKSELSSIQRRIDEIDHQRSVVFDMRFGLESLIQDGNCSDEIRSSQQSDFESHSKSTLKSMKSFIETSGLPELLKSVSKEYRKHTEEMSELLKYTE
ncbi:hypothetical protein ENBRE01_0933 [Enteropsectra breve]|nr:hypothetical protein ENBRE01_0933 [Enteropsectra breve]